MKQSIQLSEVMPGNLVSGVMKLWGGLSDRKTGVGVRKNTIGN
jgi:hypothetical protein